MWPRVFARAVAISLLALRVQAQGAPPSAPPPARVDTVVHRLNVDASKVQQAHYAYHLSLTRDTITSVIGDQSYAVTLLDYAGTPAILLARAGGQGVAAINDSLVIRRDDLRPLHWIASHGVAHLAVEFTPDSIYGAMTSPLGRQNIVLPNRPDLLVNTMSVDAVVAGLPLSAAWRDSAAMIVVDAGGATTTPVSLVVDGEEHITVPAGEFDCWILSIETERGSERLWITKQGQVVVRAEQILPELGSATMTRVLTQTDNPSLLPTSARLPQ